MPAFAWQAPLTVLGFSLISFLAQIPRHIAIGPRIIPKMRIPTIPHTMEAVAFPLVLPAKGTAGVVL